MTELSLKLIEISSQGGKVEDEVKNLLHLKADINFFLGDGVTPLIGACHNGHVELAALLIQSHADVNLPKKNGATPLHVASQNGHTKTVALLITHEANINLPFKDGATPLYIASQNGRTEAVALLLTHKATINLPRKSGATPLYIASENGHTEAVALLITHKANINLPEEAGTTPLYIASQNGHTEAVALLLTHKATINLPRKDSVTPLHIASQNGQTEVVALLIMHKATINLPVEDGATPLFIASQNGQTEAVALLITHKANINLPRKDGWDPLHIGAYKGHGSVVGLLLTCNADPSIKVGRKTAQELAIQQNHSLCAAVFDDYKKTPKQFEEKKDELIKQLLEKREQRAWEALHRAQEAVQEAKRRAQEESQAAKRRAQEEVEVSQRRAQEEVQAAQRRAQEEVQAAQRRAQEEVQAAQRRAQKEVQEAQHRAQEEVQEAQHRAQEEVQEAQHRAQEEVQEAKRFAQEEVEGKCRVEAEPPVWAPESFFQQIRFGRQNTVSSREDTSAIVGVFLAVGVICFFIFFIRQLLKRADRRARQGIKLAESRALAAESLLRQIRLGMVEKLARAWQAQNTRPTLEDIRSVSPSLEPKIVGAFLTAGVILQRQDIVQSILQQFPQFNLDIPAVNGVTPLYHACHNGGDMNIAKLLLHSRADPHKQQTGDGDGRETPFQAALRRGYYNVLVAIEPRTELEGVKLKDLHVIKRLGSRRGATGGYAGYYGVCSAVYQVRLKEFPQFEMAMKVIFNLHNDINSTVEVLQKFETEFKSAMSRPRHNNICTPFHVFVDSANKDVLPSWDLDPSIVNDRSVFLLMEILPQSLLQLIRDQQKNQVPNRFSSSSSSSTTTTTSNSNSSSSSSSNSSRSSANSNSISSVAAAAKKDSFNSFPYIATQLLKGVQFLQQHQVCHRDLKADNILISGSDGIVKITDFGCCVDFKAERLTDFKLPFQTSLIDRGGAREYFSPEIRNAEHGPNVYLDYSKNDNYALGRILYEMLFDNDPCDQNGVLVMDKVKEGVAARASISSNNQRGDEGKDERRGDEEEKLDVVLSLLNPDPQKRASIQEAMEMVEAITGGGENKDGRFSLWDNLA